MESPSDLKKSPEEIFIFIYGLIEQFVLRFP